MALTYCNSTSPIKPGEDDSARCEPPSGCDAFSFMTMSANDYVHLLESSWPIEGQIDLGYALSLSQEAVTVHPDSPELWHMRGMLIEYQVANEKASQTDYAHQLNEALKCFKQAIHLNRSYAEAYESLGYLYDCWSGELRKAETCFRMSIRLDTRLDSVLGLARVLAEQNREREALAVLHLAMEDFEEDDRIIELRREIVSGLWA